uniref:Uncharacterized protein n=1 Tax=Rhizophora mucronata TaxID=61149 RepID=A0A2P2KVG4_RHIMU
MSQRILPIYIAKISRNKNNGHQQRSYPHLQIV